MSKKIKIVEVGLRDGLQNEKVILSSEDRIKIAQQLIRAKIQNLEVGSFVRKDKVPQMANSFEVTSTLVKNFGNDVSLSVLVPNEEGLHEALKTGVKEVAIFAAASESFSKKNINCSIEESFERFMPVMALAKQNKIKVRGYLSTCFACPYEGVVPEAKVIKLVKRLFAIGCYEVSIGDTIGVATPKQVQSLFRKLKKQVPLKKIAGHFHDTRGTALANILAAHDIGVRTFDSSLGGLGGCPYAPGAAGNVATEDVVYMFEGMGYKTNIDLNLLVQINSFVQTLVQRPLSSKMGQAGIFKPKGAVV